MPTPLLCLGNKTVTEAGISAHDPLIDGAVCVFNLGRRSAQLQGEYLKKLNLVIEIIKELKKQHGIDLFMLQEAPLVNSDDIISNSFYTQLATIEGFEHFNTQNLDMVQNASDGTAVVILSDRQRFDLTQNWTKNPDGKHLIVEFKAAHDGVESLFIINLQSEAQEEIREVIQKIQEKHTKYIIMGGSFTLDAEKEDTENLERFGIYQRGAERSIDSLISTKSKISSFLPNKAIAPVPAKKEEPVITTEPVIQEVEQPSPIQTAASEEPSPAIAPTIPAKKEEPVITPQPVIQEVEQPSPIQAASEEPSHAIAPTIPAKKEEPVMKPKPVIQEVEQPSPIQAASAEEPLPSPEFTITYEPQNNIVDRFVRHLWSKGDQWVALDPETRQYSISHFIPSPPVDGKQQIKITNLELAQEFQAMLQQEAEKAKEHIEPESHSEPPAPAPLSPKQEEEKTESVDEIPMTLIQNVDADLINQFKESAAFKNLNILLDEHNNIPGLTLNVSQNTVLIAPEALPLHPILEQYKREREQIGLIVSALDDILVDLKEHIGEEKHHHWSKAQAKANTLLGVLGEAVRQYERDLGQYLANPVTMNPNEARKICRQRITLAIHETQEIFQNDLTWSDYLKNLLKRLLNTLSNSNYFTYHLSNSYQAALRANANLNLQLKDDIEVAVEPMELEEWDEELDEDLNEEEVDSPKTNGPQ